MRVLAGLLLAMLAGLSSGCTSDDYVRSEGVTLAAGNAQAANAVLQMVDPWKYGVQNTRLLVPAERGSATAAGAADQASGAKTAQASTTTN